MPIITLQSYHPPRILFNGHLETIYPALFRKINHDSFESVSLKTNDDDFLDLDWYNGYSEEKVVIICHGLEGDSARPYMKGMARAFNLRQWDAIAWNYRGCSGRINLSKIFYHSGATYDLEEIVSFARKRYQKIFLAGFSLGGNLVLKYLGEREHCHVEGAAVFSVPLDLYSCSREMEKQHNLLYNHRFLRNLKKKILSKRKLLNGELPLHKLPKIKTLYDFDDLYTAPLHGFTNAQDYYEKCSSINFLSDIKTPALVVNARNDPFLTPRCFPAELVSELEHVHLEITNNGGHVGFSVLKQPIYWSEQRAVDFAENIINGQNQDKQNISLSLSNNS